MEYHCSKCDMGVKGMACSKCGAELVNDTISVADKTVQVAKCPEGCGKIKSPQCCGHDMAEKK
jgi:hypothetical protein